jgi:8-oxo-dGTP pyrophosphatase MutT (NUDIX family)
MAPRRAAGIVPLRLGPDGWRLLILRVYRNWDFPKGELEEGEDLLTAAVREAAEEAAIEDLRFPWGHDGCSTAPYSRGKVATYFLGQTDKVEVELPISPELGRPEHHEGRWVDFDGAAALLPDRLQPILAWARERVEA